MPPQDPIPRSVVAWATVTMARIRRTSSNKAWIVAQNAGERHLLASGMRSGGRIVLQDGYYDVTAERLLLPRGISAGACERLARAFERAAHSHEQALSHRRVFRIVDDER